MRLRACTSANSPAQNDVTCQCCWWQFFPLTWVVGEFIIVYYSRATKRGGGSTLELQRCPHVDLLFWTCTFKAHVNECWH